MRALHLIDGGVALLILVGLIGGAARRFGIDRRFSIFLMLLVLAFPHTYMRQNTSSLLTGVVFLVSWYCLYADRPAANGTTWRLSFLTALTASGLCALKSTFIPFAIVFFVSSTIANVASAKDRRPAIQEAVLASVLITLMVLPWMISMFESSGTLLYPVLGKGFHGRVFTNDFASVTEPYQISFVAYLQTIWKHLSRLLLVILLLVNVRDSTPRRPAFSLAVAVISGVIALVVIGDPSLEHGLIRYSFGFSMAAFLGLSLEAFRGTQLSNGASRSVSLSAIAAFAIGALFILHSQDAVRGMYIDMVKNVGKAWAGPSFVSSADLRQIAEIEAALPTGASVIATLRHPYMLDLTEKQVSIMSLPGWASLPPGLPIDEGSEAVAGYLLDHGLRYLAYGGIRAVTDLLELTEDDIRTRYPASKSRWVMLRYHERYQHVVRELAATRKRLYFDGHAVVLDLAEQVSNFVPEEWRESSSGEPQ